MLLGGPVRGLEKQASGEEDARDDEETRQNGDDGSLEGGRPPEDCRLDAGNCVCHENHLLSSGQNSRKVSGSHVPNG